MPLVSAFLFPPVKISDAPNGGAGVSKALAVFTETTPQSVICLSSEPLRPADPYSPPPADPNAVNALGLDQVTANNKTYVNDTAFIEELAARSKPMGWVVKTTPVVRLNSELALALAQLKIASNVKLVVLHLPIRAPAQLRDFGLILGAVAARAASDLAILGVGRPSTADTDPEAGVAFTVAAALQGAKVKGGLIGSAIQAWPSHK